MRIKENPINILRDINSENKRKKFLIFFFTSVALLSLSAFGIKGIADGKIIYSTVIFVFFILSFANLIILFFLNKIELSAHIMLLIMFVFGLVLFCSLGVERSALFWYYVYPPLSITLLDRKKGTIYSLILIVVTLTIQIVKPDFLINTYSNKIIFRFVFTYSVVALLINILEYARNTTYKAYLSNLIEIKEKNEKLITAGEELRQNYKDLQLLNKNIKSQKDIIKEKEQRLKTIIDNQGEGFAIITLNGTFTFNNPVADDIFDLSKNELLGKNISGFFNKKQIESFMVLINKLKPGKKETIELNITTPKGNKKIIVVTVTPDYNKENKILGLAGIIRDITEIKKAEKKIQKKTAQQRILIDNIPASIFYKNEKLQYVLLNNSYSKMLNIPLKKILGKKYSELFNSREGIEYEILDRKILETKKNVFNIENQHINHDGSISWVSVSKVPYFDKNNKAIGIVGIVQDITKRKKQEQLIIEQNRQITIAHKDITDSINYAKTIQNALLPTPELENKLLKEHFILFLPKENLSGDFYYVYKNVNRLLFAAADCTGHGVPGAFLTMLSITFLNDIIRRDNEIMPPNILEQLRGRIKGIFSQFGTENQNGLDIAFCSVDTKTNILQYAGAFNPLWIVRNNELLEYKATRNPIGFYLVEKEFENHQIQLQNKDLIYLFSDGYQDQFGGEYHQKFTKKRFKDKLLKIHKLPLSEQKIILTKTLQDWKNGEEQIDDITVMGVKWIIKK